MKRIIPLLLSLLAACASSQSEGTLYQPQAEPQLPNATLQTAAPLTTGVETSGSLGCGQTAWYALPVLTAAPLTMHVYGQALENALGATATLTFVAPNGQELGQMILPVFARSPNWDPREQTFVPPIPGTYYARVTLDPNGCQRVGYRLRLN